jgi:hypothetical protein
MVVGLAKMLPGDLAGLGAEAPAAELFAVE